MAKVLVTDSVDEKAIEILRGAKSVEVVVDHKISAEDLLKTIDQYEGIIIRSRTKMTAEIIQAGKNLKIVARAGVGVDNVDLDAATKQGVIVVNSPEGNTVAAAEHTVSLMMALSRQIPAADLSMKAGKWDRNKFMGTELYNKTLGLVGFGKIGGRVAKVSSALGMQVLIYDPFVNKELAEKEGYKMASLDELFAQADYITLHIPKTKDTANLINAENMAKMKKGVRIINCARGGLIDEKALAEALKSGHVGGAALDVFGSEPPEADNPLISAPNIVLTPHLGASTEEAQVNVALDVAEQVRDVLTGGMPRAAVNIPAMKPEVMAQMKPYLPLVEKMGAIAAQVVDGAIQKVKLSYLGEVSQKVTTPLTTAILKGLLTPTVGERVNFVNAPIIAKERGIEVEATKAYEAHDYTDLILLEVVTDKGTHTVGGTLLDGKNPHIVKLDHFAINMEPTGHMLAVYHLDQPGMIGRVGMLLGDQKVNIAGMQVGRERVGGPSVMVLNIDDRVPDTVLAQVSKIQGIEKVKLITL